MACTEILQLKRIWYLKNEKNVVQEEIEEGNMGQTIQNFKLY